MSVAITLDATTTADRITLQATLAAYAGETVTFTDNSKMDVTGVLTVGEHMTDFLGDDGFTVTVSGANGDFVATGVWTNDDCGNIPTKSAIVVG